MKKKYWYYVLGGVGVVTVGYYLYSLAKPKTSDKYTLRQYIPEFRAEPETPLSSNIYVKRIDLSQARNDEELIISAKYLSVLKSTGKLSIKINDRSSASFDLTEVRSISSNVERLYLTNEAQSGCYVDLLISEGSIGIDYYPKVPDFSRVETFKGNSVKTVNVTTTEQSIMFNIPSGTVYAKAVDVYNKGDEILISYITPSGTTDWTPIPPSYTYTSIPIMASGFKIKLASGSVASTAVVIGWY